ncbi:MAG TPA: hypothetical protein VIN38_02395 [Thiobacillus sp.]
MSHQAARTFCYRSAWFGFHISLIKRIAQTVWQNTATQPDWPITAIHQNQICSGNSKSVVRVIIRKSKPITATASQETNLGWLRKVVTPWPGSSQAQANLYGKGVNAEPGDSGGQLMPVLPGVLLLLGKAPGFTG